MVAFVTFYAIIAQQRTYVTNHLLSFVSKMYTFNFCINGQNACNYIRLLRFNKGINC
jgi:hypothetical protein